MKTIELKQSYDDWEIGLILTVDGKEFFCDHSDDDLGAGTIKQLLEYLGHTVIEQEKVEPTLKCSICDSTENVKYVGGHQPYLCDSEECIPF